MIKVGIIGATGYAGQQLLWILKNHKKVKVEFISSHSFSGNDIGDIYKNYKKYFEKKLISIDEVKEKLSEIDVLFLALPHGMSEKLTKEAVENNVKVIDLGADFRLDDSTIYEKWYKVKHEFPNINKSAIYGLPEIYKEEIRKSKIISSPGCYPTSAILGVAPLLKHNLVNTKKIVVDSKSGVSGAGRNAKVDLIFTEVNENFKAYNVLQHRHTPEIKQEMDKLCNSNINLVFTPHLLPINRGILSTIYLDVKEELKEEISEEKIYKLYKEFYKNEHFVRITEDLPEIKNIKNSNICEIGIRYDREYGNIVVVSAIDNLIKGAGGQAVQSMNIMFGLDEFEGLEFLSMYL
ncbi:MAG: N-acetyl-gamma-glutamyl-phosphate reductase [Leptotrichiaceae bacterium]|nr:N-acetyl-gamma-glutamyl-phosphate reductase [Leptotrichiaceae bacterium]MBP6281395.1 N-acetyl-gamma-glutamyl-phosphate reductase [Leptotrichiaceae bacterium]MBP7100852.1 N-acetyl-gamma-glutamyl-phosphate reductase [Leptotrichiaceae bacterium]MBP7725158.1 N-acetyl-gamma-glutamyl-phosphate reductase [Leptotrichiaceae bacterium]MBP9629159.1 N-acetyl-gamma-glutamyl-phosphate reductase [Leptotrichiaceae bacterium]